MALNVELGANSLLQETKEALLSALWDYRIKDLDIDGADASSDPIQRFDAYFTYYWQQCDLIGCHDNGEFSSVSTHRDVARVVELLKRGLDRDEVLQQLPALLGSRTASQHDNSIDLAARVLLMIKFGEMRHEMLGGRPVLWRSGSGSLQDLMHRYFTTDQALGHERVKLEKNFNAVHINLIAGVGIRWVDNLADHLKLIHDDTILCVFHHVSFLRCQENK